MKGNLRTLEKELRSYAKRCKNVKYTSGLLLTFLLTGMLSLANSTSMSTSDSRIEQQKKNISNSILDIRQTFKKAKSENNKLLRGANLELIQLVEQGDQIVKSPWSSWQFGINYFYDNWNGVYKGRGDKAEKYPYEGVFTRGEWWQRNVSSTSETYSRVVSTNDTNSSLTNTRSDLGLQYGLVGTKEVEDLGVVLIIQPKINIKIPAIPNLSINPTIINPNISFTIPDISTVTFTPTTLPDVTPNVFNPPALNEVATGFSQDMQGSSFYAEPNVIINNASSVSSSSGTTVSIVDNGFSVDNGFTYNGQKGSATSTTGTGTVSGTWTFDQSNPTPGTSNYTDARAGSVVTNSNSVYNAYTGLTAYRTGRASSPQTVFSFTMYEQSIQG